MRKGISLIVLIITMVVIIVLATAIIVNIAQTNIIGNANVSVLKNDLQAFNEELQLYKVEELVEQKGKFKPDLLNANYENILLDEKVYKEGNIYDILTKLKGSKYDKKIYVQEGKIVVDVKKFSTEQILSLKEIGISAIDASLKLKTVSTSTYTSVTAKMIVSLGEIEKYYFRLGDSGKYIESEANEYTFEGLEVNTNYTVYMKVLKADGEESTEYIEKVTTKDIIGEVTITRTPLISNGEYTNEDIKVELSYVEDIPTGYELQYKIGENNWSTYTNKVTITENTIIKARLYNKTTDDEKASNSVTITCIDKSIPTATMTVQKVTGKAELNVSIAASDDGAGLDKIMYYYKKLSETDYKLGESITLNGEKELEKSFAITKLEGETTYNVYAVVYDKAGKNMTTNVITITTAVVYDVVFDNINGAKNTTINGGDFAYNNPVIPVGFMAVNTTDASWNDSNGDGTPDGWNNGLVIADAIENEFVWVPCTLDQNDTTKILYKKRFDDFPKDSYIKNVVDDKNALPTIDGVTINETEQISLYSGFYVARYEAGKSENSTTTGIPIVKRGSSVWTDTYYTYLRTYAIKMYENTISVKSGLITGTAWDTLMTWIESEKNVEGISIHDIRNSVTWGNYSDTTGNAQYDVDGTTKLSGKIQTAGKSEYWKAKNIYDLAGNLYDLTAEFVDEGGYYCIKRGGYVGYSGVSIGPAAIRKYEVSGNAGADIHRQTARIMLYII